MMGYSFPENFRTPYFSRSFSDFWTRWHISLSSWIRDYVYIPLGGNRHGLARKVANGWIAFGLCGLWHGAAWNFVFWGLYHGAGLALVEHVNLEVRGHGRHGGEHQQRGGRGGNPEGAHFHLRFEVAIIGSSAPVCVMAAHISLTPIKQSGICRHRTPV